MFSCALIFSWVSLFLLFNSGHISLHGLWAGCHATQRHGWFLYEYGFEKQAMKWRFSASLIWMLSCFCKVCVLNNDAWVSSCVASVFSFSWHMFSYYTHLQSALFCRYISIFGLWKNGHSGHRTQPYRDLFNKLDKQLQTEAFDLLWHLLCDSCLTVQIISGIDEALLK